MSPRLHADGLVGAAARAAEAGPAHPRRDAVRRRRAVAGALGVRVPGGARPGGRRRRAREPLLQDARGGARRGAAEAPRARPDGPHRLHGGPALQRRGLRERDPRRRGGRPGLLGRAVHLGGLGGFWVNIVPSLFDPSVTGGLGPTSPPQEVRCIGKSRQGG